MLSSYKHIILGVFLILSFIAKGQQTYWTDFKNINDSLRTKPKPLMVFIHTDWCKFCKQQEQTSFADTNLLKQLSEKYYCLKLNAESKEDIKLLNHLYSSNPNDYHSLVSTIGITKEEELTLPSTVFLQPSLQLIYRHKGLMTKQQLEVIVK